MYVIFVESVILNMKDILQYLVVGMYIGIPQTQRPFIPGILSSIHDQTTSTFV